MPIYLDSSEKFLFGTAKETNNSVPATGAQLSPVPLRFPTRLQLETDLLNLFTLRCRCRRKMPEPSYRFMDVGIFLAYFCKRNFRHLRFVLKQHREREREREKEGANGKAKTIGNL